MEITTRMEFDAGHRIPNHKSSCKNLHGHRYAIEVTLKGEIIYNKKESDFGIVLDFKDAKEIIINNIVKKWDHAFLVFKEDKEVIKFLNTLNEHKTIIFPLMPTAENIALVAMKILKETFKKKYGKLIIPTKVRLFETPNNWADAY